MIALLGCDPERSFVSLQIQGEASQRNIVVILGLYPRNKHKAWYRRPISALHSSLLSFSSFTGPAAGASFESDGFMTFSS